jgi:hypothetical protein
MPRLVLLRHGDEEPGAGFCHFPVGRAFQRTKAAPLPVYLFWAFSGVTLAHEQMVILSSAYHHDVHRTSNPMLSATQSRVFRLSPDAVPKKPGIAPLISALPL